MFTKDNVILVTGASSGIGQAIALELNALGAQVIAQGRNEERLNNAKASAKLPALWHNEVLDFLENLESIPSWINQLKQKYGKLWGLVHCAGEGLMDNLNSYELNAARQHFDLNFHTPILLAKGFSDRRNFVKGGALLFLSSSSAVYPEKGHLLYGAAKSALTTAAKVISQEVVAKGLRVHCLSPGIVDTPLQEKTEIYMGEQYRTEQLMRYPLGFAQPEDIAHLACFLLSEKAKWLTGQNYIMGGGCY